MCSSSIMWYHKHIVHVIRRLLQTTPELWRNRILESLLRSLIRRKREGLTAPQHAELERSPVVLNEHVILQIMDFLDDHDKIASAYSCQWFRQILQDNPRLMRKVNLSKCIAKRQQSTIRKLLWDEQMFQHITELNLNNQRMRDGQTRLNIEMFIMLICPQLEALHVMNCGLSLVTLYHVLRSAPKLTVLSFSITDLSREDALFMMLFNDIRLENIRKLSIESLFAVTHIRILKYLVLSCCKLLEELEICMWNMPRTSEHIVNLVLGNAEFLHKQSAEPFQHFHSLTLRTLDSRRTVGTFDELAASELHKFIDSVVEKKSSEMNWKKLWISPLIDSLLDHNEDLFLISSFAFALAGNDGFPEDKPKSLVPKMNDRVLRKLQVYRINQVHRFYMSIARIGVGTLQSLSLSSVCEYCESDVPSRHALNSLFSTCANIRELSLLLCHFQGSICESLSKLKHLVRVQLQQCAIAPDRSNEQAMHKGNVEMLTFVESCPNVKEFDLRGCIADHGHPNHVIVNDDLLPIAKWTKLESLTCCSVQFSTEQENQKPVTEERHANGFLRIVAQNCKFLQTLRIAVDGYVEPYLAFLEHTKRLKHLGYGDDVHLGSQDVWKLLSSVTNLERICIESLNEQPLNIAAAVEMIRNLPRLHVLHLHLDDAINNIQDFRKQIMKTLEEEKSDRIFHFELYIDEHFLKCPPHPATDKDVLPLNISELCITTPFMI